MKIKRKIILTSVLSVLVIGGILGGVAVASADDRNTTEIIDELGERTSSLLDKVAEIYEQNTGVSVDSQELEKAFKQAQQAIRNDRIDAFLDKLVENGKITQEQADEYQQWLDSKPDIKIGPDFGKDFRNFGGFGKFEQMLRGRCFPETTN